mmetsp:Transcript_8307/g.10694  ORF Transcript_8307/g.10694 Transcript_8307/m.10694 type:complete len:114 (+) Transcript_8307:473-814(+)
MPGQLRLPSEKGMEEDLLSSFMLFHREGMKVNGFSNTCLFRWRLNKLAITSCPFGTTKSSKKKSWAMVRNEPVPPTGCNREDSLIVLRSSGMLLLSCGLAKCKAFRSLSCSNG